MSDKEENQKAYDSVDTDVTAAKMSEAMLVLLRGDIKEGEDYFLYVKTHFTLDEAYYITSVHLAKMLHKMLTTNPAVQVMAKMLRNIPGETNSPQENDVLKSVKDILNKGKNGSTGNTDQSEF